MKEASRDVMPFMAWGEFKDASRDTKQRPTLKGSSRDVRACVALRGSSGDVRLFAKLKEVSPDGLLRVQTTNNLFKLFTSCQFILVCAPWNIHIIIGTVNMA